MSSKDNLALKYQFSPDNSNVLIKLFNPPLICLRILINHKKDNSLQKVVSKVTTTEMGRTISQTRMTYYA